VFQDVEDGGSDAMAGLPFASPLVHVFSAVVRLKNVFSVLFVRVLDRGALLLIG